MTDEQLDLLRRAIEAQIDYQFDERERKRFPLSE